MNDRARENLWWDIEIFNLDELKRELDIQDTWDIEDFEVPIRVSREELNRFKEVLDRENDQVRKINRLRAFIREKARITHETEQELEWLRNSWNRDRTEAQTLSHTDRALEWVIWTWWVSTLRRWEGWINSITSSWWVAMKLFWEWKFVAWLGVLLSWLFGRFSLPEWEREQREWENSWEDRENIGSEDHEVDRESNLNIESESLVPWNTRYLASMRVLLWFTQRNENTNNILSSRNIASQTFNQLWSYNEENVLEWLWINHNSANKQEISRDYITNIELLLWREDFIDSVIWWQKPNWKEELTVEEIVTHMHRYTRTYERISNMTFEDFYNNNIDLWTLNISDLNDPRSDLSDKFRSLRESRESPLNWVSNELIAFILNDNSSKFNTETIKTNIENQASNEKDNEFLETFNKFWEDILETIIEDFFIWDESDKQEFRDFFTNRSLTPKEVFELFIITWWETNKDNLNTAIRWTMFFKIWSMMWSWEWHTLRWKTLDRWLMSAILDGSSNAASIIPEPVIQSVKNIWSRTIESLKNRVQNITSELWGMLSTQQKIEFAAMWALIWFLLWRAWPLRHRFSWAVTALSVVWITSLVSSALWNWRERPNALRWLSEQQIIEMVIAELQERWWIEIN